MNQDKFDLLKRGIGAKEQKLYKKALRIFYDLLAEDVNFIPALIELAILYDEIDDQAKAKYYFERAIGLDPGHYELRLHFANSLIRHEEVDAGIDQIRQAIELDEKNCDGWYYLAIAYFFYLNESVKALAIAERILEIDPNYVSGYTLLGEIYFAMNNIEESRRYFHKALQIDPTNKDSHLALSAIYGNDIKDRHQSLRHSLFLLDKDPEDKLARHNAEMALKLPPREEISQSEQAYEEGMAYLYLEQWDLAEHALRRAMKLNPSHPEIWQMLQKVRANTNKS